MKSVIQLTPYFLFRSFLTGLIFIFIHISISAQVPSDFTAINWGTAASQQYQVDEAQGRVVNGKLYTFGGFDANKPGLLPTKRSYIYDSKTDSWSRIADLPYLPNGDNFGGVTHAGITTDGTDIYLAGGVTADSAGTGSIEGTNQVWKYIVSENRYTRLPDLPVEIAAGQLEYLNGQLHYFGGFMEDRAIDVATHYVLNLNDTLSGWKMLAPLPHPRQHAGSAVFGGKIYSIGGQIGEVDTLQTQKDVNVYDPSTDTWTRVADLPVPSGYTGRGHISSAVVVYGQRIFVLGGEMVYKTYRTNMVSAYTPATNTWQNLTPLPSVRFSGVAGILDSNIYYTGGSFTNITFKGTPALPGLSFSSSTTSFFVNQNGTAKKIIKLSSNQGTPSVKLTKSANSNWLILPSSALGSLSFSVNASGLLPGNYISTVTASSTGYTSATLTVTLAVYPTDTIIPSDDAYVRDGTYAALNYGTDTSLVVKSSPSSGFTRLSYLKFSLNNTNSITSAKLRIFGGNTESSTSVSISAYGVDSDTWTESSITRNNAPSASGAALSSSAVNNVTKYYDLDVTSFVQTQIAGDKTASFLIKDPAGKNINLNFNSKENNQNPPVLVITSTNKDTIPPVVSIQFNGTSNSTNIFNNQVELVINASDQGGSGLTSTEYSLNGGAFQTYTSSILINTPGNYTVKARAQDGNGNVTVSNEIAFSVVFTTQPASDTLSPVADAFVRNGSYANLNYGSDTALTVKSSTSSGFTRYAYLKFSVDNISSVSSAKLRIYGRNMDNTNTVNLSSYGVDSDAWTEKGITFSNAPSVSTSALSSASITNQAKYYELDVTNYVKSQVTGDKIVTLSIKDPSNQNINIGFNSKENKQNPPMLVITAADKDTIPPVVSIQLNGTLTSNTYVNQVEVVINASDQGGSGLASTEYSLNGGAFQTYTSSILINTPGDDTIIARARDGNGNVTVTNMVIFSVLSTASSGSDTLSPVADAFVRNGSYANLNYGSDTALTVKGANSSGYTRYTYLKFSLSSINNVSSAKLRIYGRNTDNTNVVSLSSYGVDNDAWTEKGVTFSNAPSASTSALSVASINNQAKYYELDVTNYVKSQFAGDKVVTLLIKDATTQNTTVGFNSKENVNNSPQLVISTTANKPSSSTGATQITGSGVQMSEKKSEKPFIYPNPVNKGFTISFPEKYSGKVFLEIIDQTGKTYNIGNAMLQRGGGSMKVDVSNFTLSAGVYFLKIASENANDQIKFIIH